MLACEGALACRLDEIVGFDGRAGEPAGEPAQPRQDRDQLVAEPRARRISARSQIDRRFRQFLTEGQRTSRRLIPPHPRPGDTRAVLQMFPSRKIARERTERGSEHARRARLTAEPPQARVNSSQISGCAALCAASLGPCRSGTATRMKVAVVKERRAHERRVAASPDTVKRMVGMGLEVVARKRRGRRRLVQRCRPGRRRRRDRRRCRDRARRCRHRPQGAAAA